MKSKKTLCIYHGNCADGFGAAWVVKKALGDFVDFHAGVYQQEPPDVTGRDVVLVDFSYKRDVLLKMAEKANSITIIDHHKSAAKDLYNISQDAAEGDYCSIGAIFDMEHSGAMLTWLYYFPNEEPPQLIKHIEDRDLWRFNLTGTREIQAALFSYPYDFEVWDRLMEGNLSNLYNDGIAIERKHFKDVNELIGVGKDRINICGFNVPILNAPYFFSSDAGHIMGTGEPFAVCYWDTPEGRVFSLRSDGEKGEDVSKIASFFGGGGHRNAAGFKLEYFELNKLSESNEQYTKE